MYVALIVPYRVGFQSKDVGFWLVWNFVMDGSFLIDIILTFFTSYLDEASGEMVYDPKKIAKNYLSMWFWIDTFSIMPIEKILNALLSAGSGGKINILAKFPRIARLY